MRLILIAITLALAMTGLLLVAGCGSSDTDASEEVSLEESQSIARDFLVSSPTFKFDGVPESVKLIASSESTKDTKGVTSLLQYAFAYEFRCLHAGYGDRSERIVAEVETPHTAQIVVTDGRVISAMMDEKWDMLTQAMYFTQEESQRVAEDFVRNSPTFMFDGIAESLELTEAVTLRCPSCWQFVFEFESSQAGYGDRTGQMLAQVITPHKAVITVENGDVKSAIMDGRWDMLSQKFLAE